MQDFHSQRSSSGHKLCYDAVYVYGEDSKGECKCSVLIECKLRLKVGAQQVPGSNLLHTLHTVNRTIKSVDFDMKPPIHNCYVGD